jgi:hypothetical protein
MTIIYWHCASMDNRLILIGILIYPSPCTLNMLSSNFTHLIPKRDLYHNIITVTILC